MLFLLGLEQFGVSEQVKIYRKCKNNMDDNDYVSMISLANKDEEDISGNINIL